MKTYTAFCQATDGKGTVWISALQARDLNAAIRKARKQCAADWNCTTTDVHVLGVAAGDVSILYWSDLYD